MSETKTEMVCSFCDKTLAEVEQLIERRENGPAICNECIAMSIDMLLKQLTRIQRLSNQRKSALEKARKHLQWIAQQPCTMDAELASEDTPCTGTGACITEFCLPCYAKAALRKPDEGGDE